MYVAGRRGQEGGGHTAEHTGTAAEATTRKGMVAVGQPTATPTTAAPLVP